MRYLNQTYGVRHFELVDQCVEPEDQVGLGEEMGLTTAGLYP